MTINQMQAVLENILPRLNASMATAREKKDFLNRISRELRTPLNSINGAIYYLQHFEKPVSDQQKEFFNIIATETARLTQAVEKMLEFLRVEEEAKATARTIQLFLEFVAELMGLEICSVMLSDELTGELSIAGAVGLDSEVVRKTRIKMGDRIAGRVALEGRPVLVEDIENEPAFGKRSIPRYNTRSLLSLPLKVQDKVVGVINLNNKKTAEPFNDKDLRLASMVCERVAYVIGKLHAGDYSEEDRKKLLASLERLLDAEKRYHKKNSQFQELMGRVTDRLGMSEEDKQVASYVSLIYDLGLVSNGDTILKKDKLLPAEARSVKVHPYTTVDMISGFEFSEEVKEAILHHHERYDGTGYPDGLKSEEIPRVSRALSVVDAYFSMTARRPYRKTFSKEKALYEIRAGSGTAYDPRAASALISCIA